MNLKKYLAVLAALTIGSFASTAVDEKIIVSTEEELIAAVADANYGTIFLGNDIDLTAELAIGRSLTLDLSGYVLKQTASETRVLSLNSGATLTITDGNPYNEHTFQASGDEEGQTGVWTLYNNETGLTSTAYEELTQRPPLGNLTVVKGGAITGGSITGKDVHGGGILINNGSLIINAGNIIGNKAYAGGGICCHSGSVTQNGGRVVGNALSGNDSGGGVYMQGGTYTLEGGEISFNRGGCGGGVNAGWSSQNFIMTGGQVAYNYGGQGGGVAAYHNGSLTGGVITRNIVKKDNDGQIYGAGAYFGTALTVGGTIQISGNTLKDTSTPNNLYVDTGKDLTISSLDASARIGITTHALPGESSPVTFVSSGATQNNLDNFSSDSNSYGVTYDNSKLKLSVADYACQIFVGETEGKKYMSVQEAVNSITETGKTIKLIRDNSLTSVIRIENDVPAFILDLNGYVLKQFGYDQRVIENDGDLTIVDSNPTTTHYLLKSGDDWNLQNSQPSGTEGEDYVTVSGGCITGGNIPADDLNGSIGGGILNYRTLYLKGGNICGNKAVCGSGIWHFEGEDCTVAGNVKVKYNTNSNLGLLVYLDAYVAVGTPSAGMEVGITTYGKGPEHYDPTYGRFSVLGTAESAKSYFFSDDSGYLVQYNAGSGSGGYLETVAIVPPTTGVCQILHNEGDPTPYATIAEAISNVAEGETIQLIADVTESIHTSGTFTLDLNDHLLFASPNESAVYVGGALTIVDNAPSKTPRYFAEMGNVWTLTDIETKWSVQGGCITGANSTQPGGGVQLTGAGTLTLLGGNISGNNAPIGGGIYIVNGSGNALTVGGTAVVKYNTGTNVSPVIYDMQDNRITIGTGDQAPQAGMEIGMTVLGKGDYPSTGIFAKNAVETDVQYFFSDNPKLYVVQYGIEGKDGYLEMIDKPATNVCVNVETGKEYLTLDEAVSEVLDGQTIKLLDETDLSDQIAISGKTFTLDLAGKDINAAPACRVFYIYNGAGLTITDSYVPESEEDEGGHISSSGVADGAETDGIIIYNFGSLTIAGGIFQNVNDSDAGSDGAIANGVGSTFVMTGGTIRFCSLLGGVGGAIVIQKGNVSAEISGGLFYNNVATLGGAIAIEAGDTPETNGKLTISGGDFYYNSTAGELQYGTNMGGAIVNGGDLTVTGGAIHNNGAGLAGGIGNRGNLTVGGTASIIKNYLYEGSYASNLVNAYGHTISIGTPADGMKIGITQLDAEYHSTTGQFTQEVAADYSSYFFSDSDYFKVQLNTTGNYLELAAQEPACKIVETDTEYPSIQAAVNAIENDKTAGRTIKMIRDIEISEYIHVNAEVPAFKLDLDGYVLKQVVEGENVLYLTCNDETGATSDVTIMDSNTGKTTHYFEKKGNIWVLTDEVTEYSVSGGCITGGHTLNGDDGGAIQSRGILRIESGNICGNCHTNKTGGSNDGGAIASRGDFYMTGGEICYNYSEESGGGIIFLRHNRESIISGGKIHDNVSVLGGGISMEGDGETNSKLTITGGEFYNNVSTYTGPGGKFDIGGGGAIGGQGDLIVEGGDFHHNIGLFSGSIGIAYPGSLTMTGGYVHDNTDGYYNAGVGVIMAPATIIGGSNGVKITGNTMGIFFNGLSPTFDGGNMTLGGELDITGNTSGNVVLGKVANKSYGLNFENFITLSEKAPIVSENKIGVVKTNLDIMSGKLDATPLPGQITSNGKEADLALFKSDVPDFEVEYDTKGSFIKLTGDAPTGFELTIGEVRFASLYYDKNLVVPEGDLKVYTYTYDEGNNALVPTNVLEEGAIIPAGTGVIVYGYAGKYTFPITTEVPKDPVTSVLSGVLEPTPIGNIKGTIYAYGQPTDKNYKPAFYMISDKVTTVPAYKAYYIKASSEQKDPEKKSIMIKED